MPRDLHHVGVRAIEAVRDQWKIQRLLDRPDLFVLVGWKDPNRVTHSDPSDRHGASCGQTRSHVDDTVDSNLGAFPHASAVEDGRARCNEHLVLDDTPHQMAIGAQQAVAANASGVPSSASHHGVLHDDAAGADLDSTAFGDDRSPVHDARVWTDDHVTADGGGGRDVDGRFNLRASSEV